MPEIINAKIINIIWEGPLTLKEAYGKKKKSDKGVYQVYGDHPVYGLDVLLYIGETAGTFGERLENHEQKFSNWEQKIEIYLGYIDRRIKNGNALRSLIRKAEKLLIHACWPALNCQGVGGPAQHDLDELRDLLILNWGRFRSLPGSVSGRQVGIGLLDPNAREIRSEEPS